MGSHMGLKEALDLGDVKGFLRSNLLPGRLWKNRNGASTCFRSKAAETGGKLDAPPTS